MTVFNCLVNVCFYFVLIPEICMNHIPSCLWYKITFPLWPASHFTKRSIPYLVIVSITAIIAPSNTETVTTADIYLTNAFLSCQMTFLNSAWSHSQLFFCVFSDFLLYHHSSRTIISSLCAVCEIWRTCSTSWSPCVPDEFSYPWSCCNCGFCIPYIPMWFLCAQLPPRFFLGAPLQIPPPRSMRTETAVSSHD